MTNEAGTVGLFNIIFFTNELAIIGLGKILSLMRLVW